MMFQLIVRRLCVVAGITTLLSGHATTSKGQTSFNLDSLTYYGSGSNRSAFVVDWNNGESNEVLAWGYNWTGTLTMATMMADIAAADPEFFIRWDSDAGFGGAAFLFGLGYQNGVTPFDVSDAVDADNNPVSANFVNGVWDIDTGIGWEPPFAFTGVASNSGDFYSEGFGWSSYVAGSAPDFSTSLSEPSLISPDDWTATSLGISGIELVDEGWYGFGNNRAPNTVPEPGSGLLLCLGVLLILGRRRCHA